MRVKDLTPVLRLLLHLVLLLVAFLELTLLESVRLRLLLYRLYIPDALRILVNAAVGAEEAHPGDAGDGLGDPLLLVLVRLVDQRVRLDVAVEVVRHQVVVAVVADRGDQTGKVLRVAEGPLLDGLEDLGKVGVDVVRAIRVRVAEVLDIFGQVAKEENVVLTNFTRDLDLKSTSVTCSPAV
jgi:hypothetical protein